MTTEQQQPSDAELISAVRGGDTTAYGELFTRHVEAARRLARQLTSATDVEDLVSEAFAKVLTIVRRGGGPTSPSAPTCSPRSAACTSTRCAARSSSGRSTTSRRSTTACPSATPPWRASRTRRRPARSRRCPNGGSWSCGTPRSRARSRPRSRKLLGMSANSVSALAYRAREGLRQAFLNMHAQDAEDDACAWTQDNLGAYIRNAASKRDSLKVRTHVDECRRCMGIYLELSEVNTNLSGILGPIVLGSAAAGYIAAVTAAAQGSMRRHGRPARSGGRHRRQPHLQRCPGLDRRRDRADHRDGDRARGSLPEEAPTAAREAPVFTERAQQPISGDAQTISPDRTVPSKKVPRRDSARRSRHASASDDQRAEAAGDAPSGSDDHSSLPEDEPDGTIVVPQAHRPPPSTRCPRSTPSSRRTRGWSRTPPSTSASRSPDSPRRAGAGDHDERHRTGPHSRCVRATHLPRRARNQRHVASRWRTRTSDVYSEVYFTVTPAVPSIPTRNNSAG